MFVSFSLPRSLPRHVIISKISENQFMKRHFINPTNVYFLILSFFARIHVFLHKNVSKKRTKKQLPFGELPIIQTN